MKKKSKIKRYQVWLSFDKPIIGFRYPPPENNHEAEKDEIKITSNCFAEVGSMQSIPFEWPSKESAESIARFVNGHVETVER
jgi:hypothetical protein